MKNLLKQWFSKKPKINEALQEISGLFLQIDGKQKQVYEFIDVLKMPTQRYLVFMQYCQEMSAGIENDLLNQSLTGIENSLKNNLIFEAGAKIALLRELINNFTPMEQFINIATVFFVIEGEDCNNYDYELAEKKRDAFRNLDNKVFFWTMLGKNLEKLQTNYKLDTNSYSQAITAQKQRDLILKVITSDTQG